MLRGHAQWVQDVQSGHKTTPPSTPCFLLFFLPSLFMQGRLFFKVVITTALVRHLWIEPSQQRAWAGAASPQAVPAQVFLRLLWPCPTDGGLRTAEVLSSRQGLRSWQTLCLGAPLPGPQMQPLWCDLRGRRS